MLNKVKHMRSLFLFAVVFLFATITGCATYGKGTMMVGPHLSSKNYDGARAEIEKSIKNNGKDRLLYYMEIGLIDHLSGKYQASNNALKMAARIGEELETTRASDALKVALTSPRSGAYRGTQFERAFIHYYKTLNYSLLAVESPAERQTYLEGARIEARQVDIMLTALQNEKGNYKDVEDNEGKLFSKLMKIFDALQGRTLDENWLVYREDAYIRYTTGLTYESNGEFDDARIAYQQAAALYEKGYAKQYSLGSEITAQAWFDTIRMMKRAGGFENEWPDLAEKKLSEAMRERLKVFTPDTAQLVVITHVGMIPKRKEMNIQLTLDHHQQDLVLSPFLTGTPQEKKDQSAWFHAMYSDKGLLGLISNYQSRGLHGALDGLRSKRIGIGPVWKLAESIKLPQALSGFGARVTVPYYSPHPDHFLQTDLWLDGQKQQPMIKAESLAQLALQEQLLGADKDLKMALARELSKSMACEFLGNAFAIKACQVLGAVTSQAETRNWLTLPHTISVQRIPLSPGKHIVRLSTRRTNNRGIYHESEHDIEVKKGNIVILRERVLPSAAAGVTTAVNTF
ncbi:hypothetical protein MNBD_NITROSPIRAE01-737 [hydrothermal vent metagenome]|uniref:Uncharacterized protein n=1 Tax=hydrothermal vent metagenome TaxID=652676 RepID=A0A3B1DFJ7_9ZZZZ